MNTALKCWQQKMPQAFLRMRVSCEVETPLHTAYVLGWQGSEFLSKETNLQFPCTCSRPMKWDVLLAILIVNKYRKSEAFDWSNCHHVQTTLKNGERITSFEGSPIAGCIASMLWDTRFGGGGNLIGHTLIALA
jgi:hypothetical protein